MTGHEPHGSAHPLCRSEGGRAPWRVEEDWHVLYLWHVEDGAVVIQGDDGDVTIPASALPAVAQGLLAQHVTNGRPDRRKT